MIAFNTEEALFRILLIDAVSQQYIVTTLRPQIVQLCRYSLYAAHTHG